MAMYKIGIGTQQWESISTFITASTGEQPASMKPIAVSGRDPPPFVYVFLELSLEQVRFLKTIFRMWEHYIYSRWRRRGIKLEGVQRHG